MRCSCLVLAVVGFVSGCGRVSPAVPGLPPPPASVLQAQGSIELPQGFVRDRGNRIWCEKDGAEMVLVQAGEFTMGGDAKWKANFENAGAQKPEHRVFISAFLIDRCTVTFGQFKRFSVETTNHVPAYFSDDELRPMNNVSWDAAVSYAGWAGKRLPTEAEWERAARGSDGRLFPWGNDAPEGRNLDLYCAGGDLRHPGSNPANVSPYGCFDMIGGIWEWCSDWYGAKYYSTAPPRDPRGPEIGTERVMRGGGPTALARNGSPPMSSGLDIGIRTVKGLR